MKTVVLALIGIGLCVQARSAGLSTTDGSAYNDITKERVDPDGLYIEYNMGGGGIGMSKIKFTRLSPDLQKKYGYDEAKAKDYEAKVAKANEDFRQQCIKMDETAKARMAAEDARDEQQEKALTERILAMARLKEAEAALNQTAPGPNMENYGGSYSGGGFWGGGDVALFAVPSLNRAPRARTDFNPIATPVPFPQVNVPNNVQRRPQVRVQAGHSGSVKVHGGF